MISRQKRVDRQIADIQEHWSEKEKAALIDRIHYQGLMSEAQNVARSQVVDYSEVENLVVERRKTFNKPSGWKCGIEIFDAMTFGFRPGELIVIAGPSSHGKTSMALNIAVSFVEWNQRSVLFISMEMTDLEIFDRVDHIANDPSLLRGRFRVQKQRRITSANIGNIIAANPDVDMIFIDHLHMMIRMIPGLSSYDAVNQTMEEIKRLAVEYDKPIVLMSHVSKQRSGRGGMATAADLKDSSAIEQDADFVIMVNADEEDRRRKNIMLAKSRTKMTVGEGYNLWVHTDGLKILPELSELLPQLVDK